MIRMWVAGTWVLFLLINRDFDSHVQKTGSCWKILMSFSPDTKSHIHWNTNSCFESKRRQTTCLRMRSQTRSVIWSLNSLSWKRNSKYESGCTHCVIPYLNVCCACIVSLLSLPDSQEAIHEKQDGMEWDERISLPSGGDGSDSSLSTHSSPKISLIFSHTKHHILSTLFTCTSLCVNKLNWSISWNQNLLFSS